MKRRTFLKGCFAGAFVIMNPLPKIRAHAGESKTDLDRIFLNPPDSAKPMTWWHWINGNVTEEGITRDLEAMKDAGLGGFQLFQISGMPKGAVEYNGDEYFRLLRHVAAEAERLGLEFEMHNCPGWTSSGGPWITPELSMQQVVWTETFVSGGRPLKIKLPQPYAKRGYYRDSCILAFPSLKGEEMPMKDLLVKVTSSNGPVKLEVLNHSNIEGGIEIKPGTDNTPGYLLLEFAEPYTARAVSLYSKSAGGGGAARRGGVDCLLEASDDGTNFRSLHDFSIRRMVIDDSEADCPDIADLETVTARFFRLTCRSAIRIIDLKLAPSMRISGWTGKANYKSITGKVNLNPSSDAPDVPDTRTVDEGMAIRPETVLDLTALMDKSGNLEWDAPPGNWTILRMGSTTIGIENHPATEGGGGLECDKFSREALEYHFNNFFGGIMPIMEAMSKKGIVGALIDSYEVGLQNWTKDFPEEFKRRKGYSLLTYLLAMTGRIVGSLDLSDRFLWDLRRTQADMMADNYYAYFSELCHRHGMKSFAEPYAGGPYEEMQAASRVDVPMGEFWSAGSQAFLDEACIKLAASAAHINGKAVAGAESFTGQPGNAKWQEFPFALKPQGDWIYTLGVNRFMFHRFVHQPHPDAAPGMTMGQVGSHLDRTNTWYNRAQPWFTYLARCQAMLQQGLFVADVAFFVGEDAPLSNPSVKGMKPSLPEGYDFDTVNAETILNRMEVKDGWIALPDGMTYPILLLPDRKIMTIEVLRKIDKMVRQGISLVGPRPERTPGLAGHPSNDEELKKLADALWGSVDGLSIKEGSCGRGRVFWGMTFEEIFAALRLNADFRYTSASGDAAIHFIHRRTDDTDFYFIANHRRRAEELVCTFRVEGRQPELWNPVSGDVIKAPVFHSANGLTKMPIRLGSSGSVFVVFREKAPKTSFISAKKDGHVICTPDNYTIPARGRYPEVKDSFSITLWLKPEVEVSTMGFGLSNMAIYPPAGNEIYGDGHVACGLTAGRSGVIVYERGEGSATPVLEATMPLSGWTHLAVVYEKGIPSIYLNGDFAAKGRASGNTVHPGLKEALLADGAVFYQGDMTEPVLTDRVMDASEVKSLAMGDLPDPETPPALELRGGSASGLLIWQNGRYALGSGDGKETSFTVSDIADPVEIRTTWKVSFPPNTGAPEGIDLPRLTSLHRHGTDGVKHFSGTATYKNSFIVPPDLIKDNMRLFLDLGRVEVIAGVMINGRDLGRFWHPPYRIDITEAVKNGENSLEVDVTNLWPNRLIGDEQLPAENEYDRGIIKAFPDWYLKGEPKPRGGRICFAAIKCYDKDSPLLESGLLGPVRLRTAVCKTI